MFERFFQLSANKTDTKTEILAGMITFLTMSYIIFVNPSILSTTGMEHGAVFVATCLAAAIGCFIMAFVANYPIGMAPGMGLNAFFAFGVVAGMGYSWQQALGAVFISGVIFLILTITGVRKWIVQGIPTGLRSAIAGGIGMFLAIIALQSSGIVVDNPATLVTMGSVHSPSVLYTILGLIIIALLSIWRIKGAILIGIMTITLLAIFNGHVEFKGITSIPPSLAPTFLAFDLKSMLNTGIVYVIITFVLVEIFDATGTLVGVLKRAHLLTPENEKRFEKALFADSTAIVAGSMLGTSSTTAYIESVSGVESGGRTGLTALVVGLLFVGAIFFSPLAAMVPPYATAPALLFVSGLMLRELVEVQWEDLSESLPAGLTVIMMPFTYSIATGMAFGFISYVVLKAGSGKIKELHPATIIVAILFVIKFAMGH